jgi:DNA-binding NtrC family response regulator
VKRRASRRASNTRHCLRAALPPRRRRSLLLIDDCPETASELRALIVESFPRTFALEWATSLGEAMTILEQRDVSIVVSEVQVGNEDMTPLLKTLKRFKPHIVSIVLTSFNDASQLVALIDQGLVHRFLPKPMRKVMTVRGIQSGIDRSREIQQRPESGRRKTPGRCPRTRSIRGC